MQITVQAQAKINWALDILSRREDGYHEMDMLMQKIALSDEIRFEAARWTTLTVNGHLVGNAGKNLIVRAANRLNEYMGEKRGVRITLEKRIPVRAGLGGGSADCAAALVALNDLWGFRLPVKTLKKLALSLGADVPYCMENAFCRVRGIGEDVQTLENAPKIPLVVVCVNPGLSTQAVFTEFDAAGDLPLYIPMERLHACLASGDFRAADAISGNALERAAIRLLPAVADTMEQMRAFGSLYTRMSGSGSAVFGVFETREKAQEAAQRIEGAVATETV